MTEPNVDILKQLEGRLCAYREAFDSAFSIPVDDHREELIDVITIGFADTVFALRVNELSGLQICGNVVPIPGTSSSLLGIVGIRGMVVPVFCLATLLGCTSDNTNTRWWLALCDCDKPLGLAFDSFLGVQSLQPANIYPANTTDTVAHAPEIARNDARVLSVISVPSVMEEIYALNSAYLHPISG